MKKALILSTALVALAMAGPATAADDDDLWPTFRGVDQHRVDSWIRRGATAKDIDDVMDRIAASSPPYRYERMIDTQIAYGPGHWVYEWSAQADRALSQAEVLREAEETERARDMFLRAAQLYSLAKAVYIRDEDWPYYQAAYVKAMEAYEAFGALLDTPLEVIDVPYRGEIIRAYLHLPKAAGSGPIPLVIGAGGIDVFKPETWPVAKRVMDAGMAYVVLDMPGMGESNDFRNMPDHETAFLAVHDAIAKDDRFDQDRIAVYATSWSGNAVARLAVLHGDRFAALVSACGPVHEPFDMPTEAIRADPGILDRSATAHRLDVLADRFGIGVPRDDAANVRLAELLPAFSLVNQDLLSGDIIEDAPPLLVINSRNDPVLPIQDMTLIASAVRNGTVIFTGDGGHCGNLAQIHDYAVEFIADHVHAYGS